MAEAQYASLDDAALSGTEPSCFAPNPKTVARRSVSIFSRRGTETPESKPPFIVQATMKTPERMSERQKSWIGRRKSACGGRSPKASEPCRPKGTILNAVPPTRTIKMTALEEEMATSPNEVSSVGCKPSLGLGHADGYARRSCRLSVPSLRTSSHGLLLRLRVRQRSTQVSGKKAVRPLASKWRQCGEETHRAGSVCGSMAWRNGTMRPTSIVLRWRSPASR